jgi:DNA-binding MarR family transcriptional regulator
MEESGDRNEELDTQRLKALSRAVLLYREQVPSSSVLQLYTFLVLASQEKPIGLTDLARAVGTGKPVISAAVENLGGFGRGPAGKDSSPPNLVHCKDHPSDRRSKLAELTPKGAALAAKLCAILGGLP